MHGCELVHEVVAIEVAKLGIDSMLTAAAVRGDVGQRHAGNACQPVSP